MSDPGQRHRRASIQLPRFNATAFNPGARCLSSEVSGTVDCPISAARIGRVATTDDWRDYRDKYSRPLERWLRHREHERPQLT